MTGMDVKNLAALYGAEAMDWEKVASRLEQGMSQAPETGGPGRHTSWLVTLNPDGSPHVTGVGALWVESAFWFETGETTRKGRNLARDPRCALTVAAREFDLTVEGVAEQITDRETVAALAERWAKVGWPVRVDESGAALTAEFSAQSAGKPPWHVYRLEVHHATAVETVEPFGASRWTF